MGADSNQLIEHLQSRYPGAFIKCVYESCGWGFTLHGGELNGIAPTHRTVELPFAISYEIENEKIVHHWMIIDRMAMMEQLGVMNVPA